MSEMLSYSTGGQDVVKLLGCFFYSVCTLIHPHQFPCSSRRCKLRVLDLRDTGQNFWSIWSGASSYERSSSRMVPVAEQSSTAKLHLAPLKIFMDLCLKKRTLDNFLTYLLRWVEQRKASVHLCCKKLKISAMPMDNVVKILSMVQLDCIQEVQVNWIWHLSTLATFASFLGKMSNLQRLCLSPIHLSAFTKQEQDHLVQITSQFLRLGHLQDLHLDYPSFLEGFLDQMLRQEWTTSWVTLNTTLKCQKHCLLCCTLLKCDIP